MKNFCAFCEHFLGGGDWGTSCSVQYDLCYEHYEACEHFKEDYLRKQAFRTGISLYEAALKNQKPKINADKIRAMSVEELAILCEDGCPPHDHHCPDFTGEIGIKEICQKCWLDWLRKEAKE